MADKADKKDKPSEGHNERVARLLTEIFALILFLFLVTRLISVYSTQNSISESILIFLQTYGILVLLYQIIFYAVVAGIILSILFLIGIIILSLKLHEINKIWYAMLHPKPEEELAEEVKNPKWQRIMQHLSSASSSDWRLAILECDIVLDELFDKLGYVGGTIGDKLKGVEPAHFKTLNNAWEAHKIRNAIAHEGQDFNMTDREARRVVSLYESVFREFDFI